MLKIKKSNAAFNYKYYTGFVIKDTTSKRNSIFRFATNRKLKQKHLNQNAFV